MFLWLERFILFYSHPDKGLGLGRLPEESSAKLKSPTVVVVS